MKIFLIVSLSLVGFIFLVIGGLVILWFYQGGCCIRRIKNKITKKDYAAPVLKENSSGGYSGAGVLKNNEFYE